MSKLRGLPETKRMRHDSHFVDEITSQRSEAIGRMIDLRRIRPNPHQPRKDFGDLSEMVSSVKEKGILEPILVRQLEDGVFEIIAGERRYQAAKLSGLQRAPCVEVDVDARGMLEISLIENLQRRDLTAFEESAAIQRLCDQFRYTHEEIARKLGKSRTVITEILSLNRMPDDVQERCRQADIVSKSMLLQIVRLDGADEMHRLIDKITGEGYTREQARRFKREENPQARPRPYTYRFKPETDDYSFTMTFKKPEVDRQELIEALTEVLRKLTEAPGDSTSQPAGAPMTETRSSFARPRAPRRDPEH